MNRNLVATARKQLLRRGRALLRAAQAGGARPDAIGALGQAELTELQEIHSALERIERGIYGRCEGCHSDLEEEQIQRAPWARRCTTCDAEPAVAAPELVPATV
jgi:hypothetical protein